MSPQIVNKGWKIIKISVDLDQYNIEIVKK